MLDERMKPILIQGDIARPTWQTRGRWATRKGTHAINPFVGSAMLTKLKPDMSDSPA